MAETYGTNEIVIGDVGISNSKFCVALLGSKFDIMVECPPDIAPPSDFWAELILCDRYDVIELKSTASGFPGKVVIKSKDELKAKVDLLLTLIKSTGIILD
jgi:hypothetical protein